MAAQGFLAAHGFLAAQGFLAAHGFLAAQGFLAAHGFDAAQGFFVHGAQGLHGFFTQSALATKIPVSAACACGKTVTALTPAKRARLSAAGLNDIFNIFIPPGKLQKLGNP
ncbi:MAG: hypothetical protein NUV50_08570 [Rhodospirillales bacterium]|nr:hypothetical protein [Rhodospirillales bacterium]